jgi:hypothetical protein
MRTYAVIQKMFYTSIINFSVCQSSCFYYFQSLWEDEEAGWPDSSARKGGFWPQGVYGFLVAFVFIRIF